MVTAHARCPDPVICGSGFVDEVTDVLGARLVTCARCGRQGFVEPTGDEVLVAMADAAAAFDALSD